MWNMSFLPLGIGFGNFKRTIKQIGKIKKEQMRKTDTKEWLLARINPKCENCNSNDYYNIEISFIKPYGLPLGKLNKVFRIVCPNCGETIELDIEEFVLIEPFLKLNNLLESGKIDECEYKRRIEKIEERHHRIL